MRKKEINEMKIFQTDMETAVVMITNLMNKWYKWDYDLRGQVLMTEDGNCQIIIGINKNSDHNNFEDRVVINFPGLAKLNLDADWRNLGMFFEFFDDKERKYFTNLSELKSYRAEEMLFNRFFIREISRFLKMKKINIQVFKTFEI